MDSLTPRRTAIFRTRKLIMLNQLKQGKCLDLDSLNFLLKYISAQGSKFYFTYASEILLKLDPKQLQLEQLAVLKKIGQQLILNKNQYPAEHYQWASKILTHSNLPEFRTKDLDEDIQKAKKILQFMQGQETASFMMECETKISHIFEYDSNKINQLKKLIDQIKKHSHCAPEMICCRRDFVQNQIITQRQNEQLEYKFYYYPFNQEQFYAIRKAICSFLNSKGGRLLIGIQQTQSKQFIVKGYSLTETAKEDLQKQFRRQAAKFCPKQLSTSLYNIKFIPIKNELNKFMKGRYLIRISVVPEYNQNFLYWITADSNQFEFWKRKAAEVVRIREVQVQNQILTRIKIPYYHIPHHCPEPFAGTIKHEYVSILKKGEHEQNLYLKFSESKNLRGLKELASSLLIRYELVNASQRIYLLFFKKEDKQKIKSIVNEIGTIVDRNSLSNTKNRCEEWRNSGKVEESKQMEIFANEPISIQKQEQAQLSVISVNSASSNIEQIIPQPNLLKIDY